MRFVTIKLRENIIYKYDIIIIWLKEIDVKDVNICGGKGLLKDRLLALHVIAHTGKEKKKRSNNDTTNIINGLE